MSKDWKELSEAASKEQDPKKLMELVEQLDKALEQCEKEFKKDPPKNDPDRDSNLYPMPLIGDIPMSA